jgi:hypothetical protein
VREAHLCDREGPKLAGGQIVKELKNKLPTARNLVEGLGLRTRPMATRKCKSSKRNQALTVNARHGSLVVGLLSLERLLTESPC